MQTVAEVIGRGASRPEAGIPCSNGLTMQTVGYREWLRSRGVDNPSEEEVRLFEKEASGNPRGSLLEFLVYIRMDSGVGYPGTRRWLARQGLSDPSPNDLGHFHKKIRSAMVWRGSLLVILVAGWFVFLWVAGLRLMGLNIVPPISGLAYGLTNAFGTKLSGRR